MKNVLLVLCVCFFGIKAQAQLPTFTEYTDFGIKPIVEGDSFFLDIDGDDIHDLAGTMGIENYSFLLEDIVVGTRLYQLDKTTGKAIEIEHPFKNLCLGVFIPVQVDNQYGYDFLLAGNEKYDSFSGNLHSIIYTAREDGGYGKQDLIGLRSLKAVFGEFFTDGESGGFKDLFMSGEDENGDERLIIYRNDNGVFTKVFDFVNTDNALEDCDVVVADIDGDGDDDICSVGTTGMSNHGFTIINNGDGTFSYLDNITPVHASSIAYGDINGDGIVDLIISGFSINLERIHEVCIGNGDGTFKIKNQTIPISGRNNSSSMLYDFDNDGDLDYYLSGAESTTIDGFPGVYGQANIYINDGTGDFTSSVALPGYWESSSSLVTFQKGNKVYTGLFDMGNTNPIPVSNLKASLHVFNQTTLSIADDVLNESISTYPNPVEGNMYLKNNNAIDIKSIQIVDTMGQIVFSSNSFVEKIDFSLYASGLYIIQIQSKDNGVFTKKIIKN